MSSSSVDKTTMKWIESLIDEHSFLPLSVEYNSDNQTHLQFGAEVITGLAKVNHRPVAVYAHNHSVNRGYITSQGAKKIIRLMDRAKDLCIPIIAFLASPGISLEENLLSGDEYTQIIARNIQLSGLVPQFAILVAPTLGAPAYSAVLMDLLFFNKHRSYLMVTSPMVVQQAIGEKVSMSELGGTAMHASTTGIADFIDDSISAQISHVKKMLDFFPSHSGECPPVHGIMEPLHAVPKIPVDPRVPFNMLDLVQAIVDNSEVGQYKSMYGQAMICAFVRIHGYAVGVVANQSIRFSGAIDSDAAQKAAKFIRICDAYRLPILTLIDVPGFMPGKREEQKGLLQHGARLCAAMQTRVPRMSVVVRKCYGAAAFLMMQTASQQGDLVLALETASLGVMGKDTTKKVQDTDGQQSVEVKSQEEAGFNLDPSLKDAYESGLIDEIITPEQIRARLGQHLQYLYRKMDDLPLARHSIV
ncbi:acetyl CoA carboxylase subunit alpha [Fluoribacter dumoffii]|uniref:acyl-CoA carboxylase subunit beta n=1 Tax=Fluoribacter dumoffii TaxID=463 RepID=UPI002243CD76|nr:carboxyl transferase domain-containing protein [Fluoribacter dumoffii]MCW8386422.1 acetyl CoA carboxylase subunit alpha [Fluoribacter dumoffii]MCW8419475.1 acetyl CoA carboxylase subunit alpha [Fluoribacter dumoffii]MCW8452650.1 acetyl CoA carboxylase subunit alpha [Fluoribacter dumoffii]MCW8460100.1 acetyl CoA carboxylase subunit alpha [Fluoribacter dumoffii]MCW8483578.1 acetyl CoA carboxylase subunit alpha [Fluoribacter dumoffii]